MNPDPDYSAAYVVLDSDHPDGLTGHGLTFTIGRGNELCVEAIELLSGHVVGRSLEEIAADMAGFWRDVVSDSQLRWLGPEKGVVHLATAALVNAVWDMYAKFKRKPLWKLLADMTPAQLVGCIDFRYIDDVLAPAEARSILERQVSGRARREAEMLRDGFPAYTTSAGWIGYSDAKIRSLAHEAMEEGFTHLKLKVGGDLQSDLRRARILREAIGPDRRLMLDANQVWGVDDAIRAIDTLREVDPWWIEEPTSPDDVLGHRRIRDAVRPIGIATGEHVHNRVMFKQLLQAEAIDFCQVDSCRLGGVNEVLAVLLLAAKFGIPVCPHAGGVGLCEYVQHLAIFDYIAVAGSLENRTCEFVDHLHEHFVEPVRLRGGRYLAPESPGYSAEIKPDSLRKFAYPGGAGWSEHPMAEGREVGT
ncbi:MAG TPA: enolase C-terminal domain-like protein [Candidatus Dormibacteraeota bacterium]|nr:enolase C-terminal domain-like protein [Candidatus Dormibacteraeota bacterium]